MRVRAYTLVEVMLALMVSSLACLALYGSVLLGRSMVLSAQQRLDAQALAFDRALEVFGTWDFASVTLATNLPPLAVPATCALPPDSEIWTLIAPNPGTNPPHFWDIEVRIKRRRPWPGGQARVLTNDARFVLTRYDVPRN